ncbi:pseudouridine synthase [Niveibacterium terrae]|uniref:pseudouridine synthase n=1 Tax=Niveibacterium terrae TaxID=3373598 RepID=UPI003A8F2308
MLEILYRDEHIVAIHKPAGLLVHRSILDRHETRFAVQLLRDQIGQRVWPAHRLDRGTSGVLVFALDKALAAKLGRQFESREVEKRYLAVVRGWPDEEGLVDHPLAVIRDEYELPLPGPAAAQESRTRFKRLATVELPIAVDRYPQSRYALVLLEPETGRRHQLRRHMKHIAHPIIGDATHGKGIHNRMFAERFASHRLLLACVSMSLTHPLSGEALRFNAPPSADFAAVTTALGWQKAMAAY